MKLDQLVAKDASTFVADEWSCLIELGPLRGSLPAQLVEGNVLPSGSVHLRFEYRAVIDHTFIGYRITRVWHRPDNTVVIRTVRSDTWVPAFTAKAGALIEVEVIINPEDWA